MKVNKKPEQSDHLFIELESLEEMKYIWHKLNSRFPGGYEESRGIAIFDPPFETKMWKTLDVVFRPKDGV